MIEDIENWKPDGYSNAYIVTMKTPDELRCAMAFVFDGREAAEDGRAKLISELVEGNTSEFNFGYSVGDVEETVDGNYTVTVQKIPPVKGA